MTTTRTSGMNTIAVVGAGQMGAGIAQVLATAGYHVVLFDSVKESLQRGLANIDKILSKDVEKAKKTADEKSQILNRIQGASTLSEVRSCDLVIEAIVENFNVKAELFTELDRTCAPHTLFATNTSSLSITKLAATTKRPDKFVGIHFMNPVPVMKLVELIRGIQTSDETYETAKRLVSDIGRTSVTAHHDYPGFIVNRILIPLLNEAAFVLMEGIASAEEIDTAMKLGTNMPMGPLELADFVGLDTCLSICQIFHRELGDDKYRPCPLLVKYVEAGWLGRKTGRGFFRY